MEAAAAEGGSGVVIKYRKAIRYLAQLDFVIGVELLAFLLYGYLSNRGGAQHRLAALGYGAEGFGFELSLIFLLYTSQAMFAILLFNGTNEKMSKFPKGTFNLWWWNALLHNSILWAETYFFIYILGWKTYMFLTLCFTKFILRFVCVQVVGYSLKDFKKRCSNAIIPVRISVSRVPKRNGGGDCTTQQDPPSYEDAIKSFKIDMPTANDNGNSNS